MKHLSPGQFRRSVSHRASIFRSSQRRPKASSHDIAARRESDAECEKLIEELNFQVAVFRDFILNIGKSHDGPEVRDKMREARIKCSDLSSIAHELLMPHIRSDLAEGIPVDSQNLVNLVCCTQFLHRELQKCRRLISLYPMDMTSYYERKPRASGVVVLDQLVLWRPPPHDYHQDELSCIQRDCENAELLLSEMNEFMPQETAGKSLIFPEKVHIVHCHRRETICTRLSTIFCFSGTNFG